MFAHNIETVERLQGLVRDRRAAWHQSLGVLKAAKEMGARVTKSSIMLGCGETKEEVIATLQALRCVFCFQFHKKCPWAFFSYTRQPIPRADSVPVSMLNHSHSHAPRQILVLHGSAFYDLIDLMPPQGSWSGCGDPGAIHEAYEKTHGC